MILQDSNLNGLYPAQLVRNNNRAMAYKAKLVAQRAQEDKRQAEGRPKRPIVLQNPYRLHWLVDPDLRP
uniref:Uncharacterized protein n=1 Tax=Utricularia reniformis TaxID=192314 RepID=A0A1Y0B4S2_9LAMI|nr:hypothetical protein AEK19_MT2231 [Utricularia reniformis]ART32377.1 hypothetical protein AEK19_MT2231 [Utricularia reniformis]